MPLSIKTEYSREMEYNATAHEQKGRVQVDAHAQFGLVGAAAMHDLNVIQGPNVTCDARDKNSIFCISYIRGGRFKISANFGEGQTIQLRRMRL